MLPVCSATTCSFCHTEVLIPGGLKPLSPYSKSFSNGVHLHKPHPARLASCLYSNQSWDSIAKNNAILPFEGLPVDPPIVSDLLDIDEHELSEINKATADIITGGVDALSNLFDNVTSSVTETRTSANEAVDNAISVIASFFNKSGESAGDKLTGISSELKEASDKTGVIALDVIKRTIFFVEDSLVEGAKNSGYAYSSAKEFLPPNFREALNLSEESAAKVLNPAGTAFQQVYMAVERFEENLGLDPNDPLIPRVLLLGLSATL